MLNLVSPPSVIDMFLGIGFITVRGPYHLLDVSLYTRTWSPGLMRYFVAGGCFDLRAQQIRFSPTNLSILARAFVCALKSFF